MKVDANHPISREWLGRRLAASVGELEIAFCWQRENLNQRFNQALVKYFKERARAEQEQAGSNSCFAFVIPQYENSSNTIRVLCPRNHADTVAEACENLVNTALHEDFTYEQKQVICGRFLVAVCSGMRIASVTSTSPKCKIHFAALPDQVADLSIDSQHSFKDFLDSLARPEDVEWFQYRPARHSATVIFSSEQAAKQAMTAYKCNITAVEDGNGDDVSSGVSLPAAEATIDGSRESEWGRSVKWSIKSECISEAVALERAQSLGHEPYKVRQIFSRPGYYNVKLQSLPPTWDERTLRLNLQGLGVAEPSGVYAPEPKPGALSRFAVVSYQTQHERDAALQVIYHYFSDKPLALKLPDRRREGEYYTKMVQTQLSAEDKPGSCELIAVFESSAAADEFCAVATASSERKVVEALVQVQHPELFDRLKHTVSAVAEKYGVQVKETSSKKKKKQGVRPSAAYAFVGKAGQCGQAAKRLSAITTPVNITVDTRAEALLFEELRESGVLYQWAQELRLELNIIQDNSSLRISFRLLGKQISKSEVLGRAIADHYGIPLRSISVQLDGCNVEIFVRGAHFKALNKIRRSRASELGKIIGKGAVENVRCVNAGLPRSLKIYGMRQSLGALMSRVGEYHTSFKQRYTMITLDASSSCFFRNRASPGAHLLHELTAVAGDGAVCQYDDRVGGIEIYLPAPNADAQTFVPKAKTAINELLLLHEQAEISVASCVFCGSDGGRALDICGHQHCRGCLKKVALNSGAAGVCCPVCSTGCSIRDIRAATDCEFEEAVADAAHAFVVQKLSVDPDHAIGVCPGHSCKGLVAREDGYSCCMTCGDYVCYECGTINDGAHTGVDCARFAEIKVARERQQAAERARREEEERQAREWASSGLAAVYRRAVQFVDDNWDPNMPRVTATTANDGLAKGCGSMQRFARAVNQLAIAKSVGREMVLSQAVFAWHGTRSNEGIVGICDDGFDPKRRSGQA
eukprot:SAG11_NODE_251_length_11596_cov_5.592763_2_plen_980_part_00